MLSTALIVFALHRPVAPPVVQITPAAVQTVASVPDAEIQARVDAAVAKAVGQVHAQQAAQTKQLISDLRQARASLLLAAQEFEYDRKRTGAASILAGMQGPPNRSQGEVR
jgi:hypothetical protein